MIHGGKCTQTVKAYSEPPAIETSFEMTILLSERWTT